jgi:hypothetical protein
MSLHPVAHWNNSPLVDMSLHLDTWSWFWPYQSLLLLLNAVVLAQKQQIQIQIRNPFFNQLDGEPIIYHTLTIS